MCIVVMVSAGRGGIGCHPLRKGFRGDGALEHLGTSWLGTGSDKGKHHPRTPETGEHRDYVRGGAMLFGATP